MNTYHWQIVQLDAKIQEEGKDNVIYTIHWRFTAKDENEPEKYQATSIGAEGIQYKEGDDFIEYADLQKSDVVGWLEGLLDVDQMKLDLDNQIELQKNPVDEYLNPDWD